MGNNGHKQKNGKKRGVKLSVYIFSLIVVATSAIAGTYAWIGRSVTLPSTGEIIQGTNSSTLDAAAADRIGAVYQTLLNNYVEGVDKEALIEGALSGMVGAIGDPYSQYLNTEASDNLDETISASFEGIGAEIMSLNQQIVVVSPIKGSPAEKAGLLPNDIIISADGQDLHGLTASEAVELIRGEKGSEVVLEITRGDQNFTVNIIRDTIPIETVAYELDEKHPEIGVVHVSSFSTPTYDDIVSAVTELRTQGATSFVFDFRQNPGGLLDQALKISNMFLSDGSVIMQTQEKDAQPNKITASDSEFGDFKITEPTVLLVDEGSASASEIVAAALQESSQIPLVGTTTFGKGTVQTVYPLTENSELKLTVAKWLTPNGNWIHEKGIAVDYEVALPDYATLTIIDSTASYQEGAVSEEVKNVEAMLNAIGYEVEADGYYAKDTVEQVTAFQADNGLETTGIVTGDTSLALVEKLREVLSENDTQYAKAVELLTGNE
ncbi:S41 family peptidase [Trichococcus ilyis]|uniref:Carboxyl-terminal processing protease n=1 Tax=Trichococcus ilyis TaxID=640938 RepID=A0A143Y6Q6_9LACT|nr:S41 family peptidase [Trichococcus ilyis]CZQ81592.1 tail specific protease [Trichococcus ilyis]SEI52562.1 carboxyl-terminal processing protease [Trichococcus ilyis]